MNAKVDNTAGFIQQADRLKRVDAAVIPAVIPAVAERNPMAAAAAPVEVARYLYVEQNTDPASA